MDGLILTPTEFVSLLNQALELAFPFAIIEGELSNFRVSKNKWVYFDVQDEQSSVKCFGTIYSLSGPLEDGMVVQVIGAPKLHNRYGFSVNIQSIAPVGEGSIRKAADLLKAKLDAEGLFDEGRKRPLPLFPESIGLITAAKSAAYADFTKILAERWGGLEVQVADVYVQGQQAPPQIVRAIEYFNALPELPEVIVITRGGGSAEDLAGFNDERVVRAVAASRVPTLVAIGHESDISLAELASDQRASTPSNAAQLVVPDKHSSLDNLASIRQTLCSVATQAYEQRLAETKDQKNLLMDNLRDTLSDTKNGLANQKRLAIAYDPKLALKRGYSIVRRGSQNIKSVKQLKPNDKLSITLSDGTIGAKVEGV